MKLFFAFLWLLLCIAVCAMRGIDWTDEGLYLYDAWAATFGHAPQSNSFFVNQGYLLGVLPRLLGSYGDSCFVFFVRLWSMLLWGGSLYALIKVLTQNERHPSFIFLCCFFCYQAIYIPTASYQSLPLFLTALGISGIFSSSLLFIFWGGMTSSLLALAYLPSVPLIFILLIVAYFRCARFKYYGTGWLIGFVIAVTIYLYERSLVQGFDRIDSGMDLSINAILEKVLSQLFKFGEFLFIPLSIAIFVWLLAWVLQRRLGDKKAPLISLFCWLALFVSLFQLPLVSLFAGKEDFWISQAFIRTAIVLLPAALYLKYLSHGTVLKETIVLFVLLIPAVIESLLGANIPVYYLSYLSPFLWSLIVVLLFQIKATDFNRIAIVLLLLSLSGSSVFQALTFSYRSTSVVESGTYFHSDRFYGSFGSEERVNVAQTLVELSEKYRCDEKFFAAIDRTPLAYLITGNPSPWVMSWVGNRSSEYAAAIKEEKEVCLVYRRLKDESDAEQIFTFLSLEPRDMSIRHHQLLGDGGISFLAFQQ